VILGLHYFEAIVEQAASTAVSVPGCRDLETKGTRVIGPLEIKSDKYGTKFARIEGAGER
jgi:hypothetical protein